MRQAKSISLICFVALLSCGQPAKEPTEARVIERLNQLRVKFTPDYPDQIFTNFEPVVERVDCVGDESTTPDAERGPCKDGTKWLITFKEITDYSTYDDR